MSRYLLDTNVISELRKGKRCDPLLFSWMSKLAPSEAYLSVITIGEIRFGVEKLKRNDPATAVRLERWLEGLARDYQERILPVLGNTAELWGKLRQIRTLPVADALIAASALENGCIIATRNTRDFEGLGIPLLNPFEKRK